MATNKIKYLLAAFIFLALSAQVFSQNVSSDEPRLTQRFSWSGGEYAFRYEVIFEQMVNNNYVPHSRQFINQRFIEVSLTIGDYRFRVIPYDILNKPAGASEWKYFKIIPAPPKVEPGPELEFIPQYEEEIVRQPEPVQQAQVPVQQQPEPEPIQQQPEPPKQAQVPEPEPEPEPAPAPKELVKEAEPEKTIEKNPYALNPVLFSAGVFASLHFPLYGKEFKEDIDFFNFGARLNVTFKLPMNMYIGLELTANFYKFLVMDEYNMYFLAPGINLVALKWLGNERIALGARFGVMYLYYTYEAFDADNLMPGAGALFRFRVTPVFNLEAGFDYFHIVNIAPGGYIRPWLGIGFQF